MNSTQRKQFLAKPLPENVGSIRQNILELRVAIGRLTTEEVDSNFYLLEKDLKKALAELSSRKNAIERTRANIVSLEHASRRRGLFESANDGDTLDGAGEYFECLHIIHYDDCRIFHIDTVSIKTFTLRFENGKKAMVTVNSDYSYEAVWFEDSFDQLTPEVFA